MNVDTDFGPLVSLELNSLFPSSLRHISCYFNIAGEGVIDTLKFHLTVVDSHIAPQEYARIQP